MQEKERRRFFVAIAAKECSKDNSAIADKKLQLNRRDAKHSERIGVSAPRYKNRFANGDTGKKFYKENRNGKKRSETGGKAVVAKCG